MTKEQLEQYLDICEEIAELKQDKVTDIVRASSTEFPYSLHTVTITGPEEAKTKRLGELGQLKSQIEAFIDSLDNSKERRVLYYRIKKGYPWRIVAAKMGYRYSEERVRHIYRSVCKKYF